MRLDRNAKPTRGIETAKVAQRATTLDQGAVEGPAKKGDRFFPKPPVLNLPSRTKWKVELDSVEVKVNNPS
jgi:hypothetical protein